MANLKRQVEIKMERDIRKLGFFNDNNHEKDLSKEKGAVDIFEYKFEKQQLGSKPDLSIAVLSELTASLSRATSVCEATEMILKALSKWIGVKRALCLAYEPGKHVFTGHLMENTIVSQMVLGADLAQMQGYLEKENLKDIEYSSIMHLTMAMGNQNKRDMTEGEAHLWADINGLWATFFWTKAKLLLPQSPVMGQLIVDIVDDEELWLDAILGYKEKIGALSIIAGNAIERLLLSQLSLEKPSALAC